MGHVVSAADARDRGILSVADWRRGESVLVVEGQIIGRTGAAVGVQVYEV